VGENPPVPRAATTRRGVLEFDETCLNQAEGKSRLRPGGVVEHRGENKMERITLWMTSLYTRLQSLKDEEGGQALVEYGLILALVAVAAVATLKLIGTNVNNILDSIQKDL
jgi:pilus assembly protein Flp/PilA